MRVFQDLFGQRKAALLCRLQYPRPAVAGYPAANLHNPSVIGTTLQPEIGSKCLRCRPEANYASHVCSGHVHATVITPVALQCQHPRRYNSS